MGAVDALVIAALPEEFGPARSTALVDNWELHDKNTATPYLVGTYERPDGATMRVALARPTRMGANSTAPVAASLVARLGPACLAMSGVCAGHPNKVALGDVVVAEMAYQHDEGKVNQDGVFVGDHRHYPMEDAWVRAAQDLGTEELPAYGAPTTEDADLWLLEQLLRDSQPNDHPARDRYFPGTSFAEAIARLEGDGRIHWEGAALGLTEEGRVFIQRRLYTDVEGPDRLPFRVHVGPMASGNVVVADGQGWRRLTELGVRSVLALDMEAAVIAAIAHRLAVPHWAVVKGVMDHANPVKNDRFKRFAATASAEVLWRFLAQQLATAGPRPSGAPRHFDPPRSTEPAREVDFFVSHANEDSDWAEWVADQVRATGFTVELAVTDWRAGDNVIERMNEALKRCRAVMALWSRAYFAESSYALRELEAADLLGKRIVPLRLEDYEPEPIWRHLRYVDLFRGGEAQARAALLTAIGEPPAGSGSPAQFPIPAARVRWPGTLPAVWNVPPPSASFTGREALLGRLRDLLRSGKRTAVHALSGQGGVGKTQLAIQYAHRESAHYDLVWWINAEQPDLIAEQFASLALALELKNASADIPTGAAAAREYLRTHDRWLVVLDNAASAADVAGSVPQGAGHVIITSRSPVWVGVATPLSIDVFTRPESIEFLRDQLPMLGEADADQLADRLGDLPLALAQAVGVMTGTGMSAREYARALGTQEEVIDQAAPPDHAESVLASVRLAYERLTVLDPDAATLVRVCAWLAPEPIPVWLFDPRPEQLPEPLRDACRDPVRLRDCLGHAALLGLIQTGADTITMHRLTQASLRVDAGALFPEMADELLVNSGLDERGEPVDWTRMSQLLPHILARDPAQTDNEELMYLATRVVWQLRDRGDAKAALALAEDLYASWQERHGEGHEDVLMAAHTLAAVYRALGDYAPARHLDRDTFIKRKELFGPDHPDTLASATSLAADLRGLEKFKLARQHDEDTRPRYQRLGAPYLAEALTSAHNLAIDLNGLGEVKAAHALNTETWAGRRALLGDNHPDTLASATSLADNLRAADEYEQACRLDEQTLARYRQVLGDDHPSTLTSANNLAIDLRALRMWEEAYALDKDTWARRARVLGENNRHTLASADNVVVDLRLLSRDDDAARIEEEVQARRLGKQGDDDSRK